MSDRSRKRSLRRCRTIKKTTTASPPRTYSAAFTGLHGTPRSSVSHRSVAIRRRLPAPAVRWARLSRRVLRRLRIENLVLIREADLTFGKGLHAVTGETGAGKTIFAQAIGLLLGARADATAVGSDGTEAYVEAELDVPEGFFDEDDVAA